MTQRNRTIGVDFATHEDLRILKQILDANGTRHSMADIIRMLLKRHGESLTQP